MKFLFCILIIAFSFQSHAETNPCQKEMEECLKKPEKQMNECVKKPSEKCVEYSKKNSPVLKACEEEMNTTCKDKKDAEMYKCLQESKNTKCAEAIKVK